MNSRILHPYLQQYLPHHKGVDSQFVNNFRKKALKFLLQRKNIKHITQEEAHHLASGKKLSAADEIIDVDDKIVTTNLKILFMKIMQEKSNTWTAIRYLEEQQKQIPGFVYSITKDDDGKPCGIMYMTPRMRQNLIRFGDLLFLDAQQRQFNNNGFPYISPCMINEENKVAQGAEALVIQESINMYTWIIKEMNCLEPRFKLSNIKFIFADQKINN